VDSGKARRRGRGLTAHSADKPGVGYMREPPGVVLPDADEACRAGYRERQRKVGSRRRTPWTRGARKCFWRAGGWLPLGFLKDLRQDLW